MNKHAGLVGLALVLFLCLAALACAQFTMPPPAEPVDPVPPSVHPLPPHTEPIPAAAECHVDTSVLNFGTYTSGQTRNLDMTMGWSMRCSERTTIMVSVAPSPDSGTYEYRLLHHLGGENASLRYQLYTTWDRSTPWGDGTGGSEPIVKVTSLHDQVEAFGRIFSNQDAVPGDYTDDVVVTFEVE